MKSTHLFLIVAVLGVALYAWAGGSTPEAGRAPRWEYKHLIRPIWLPDLKDLKSAKEADQQALIQTMEKLKEMNKEFDKEFEADLGKAGQEGWELVAVTTMHFEGLPVIMHNERYIFKRQR